MITQGFLLSSNFKSVLTVQSNPPCHQFSMKSFPQSTQVPRCLHNAATPATMLHRDLVSATLSQCFPNPFPLLSHPMRCLLNPIRFLSNTFLFLFQESGPELVRSLRMAELFVWFRNVSRIVSAAVLRLYLSDLWRVITTRWVE